MTIGSVVASTPLVRFLLIVLLLRCSISTMNVKGPLLEAGVGGLTFGLRGVSSMLILIDISN